MTTLLDTRTPDPKRLIPGATGDWEVIVGMEVHAQVTSEAKLFSGASTAFGARAQRQRQPGRRGDAGHAAGHQRGMRAPGDPHRARPEGRDQQQSVFDRKNYFYPDLPQGYQISPVQAADRRRGMVRVSVGPDAAGGFEEIEVGIERLHLEQDAGKSLHDQHPTMSYVDLNRSGVALMEIVSKPDLRSADEAKAYLTKLRTIVRYLGTCDGNMDEGSLRADVNVSVRRPGGPFGTRCEIKNVNSIRFVGQAIEYEARRQIAVHRGRRQHRAGNAAVRPPSSGETRSMRTKEEAHDYRYFPDPDLLPLEFDDAYVAALAGGLPELPDAKRERLIAALGLSAYDASILVAEKAMADYFELAAAGRDGKLAANWVINDLLGALNRTGKAIEEVPISPDQLGAIIDLIKEGTISGKIAKDLFEIVWQRGWGPEGDRRKPRHEAGDRHRRDREGGRRGDRRQSGQGRAGQGQADARRLVRRPGDEGDRRQGQPAGRQRAGQGQARAGIAGPSTLPCPCHRRVARP